MRSKLLKIPFAIKDDRLIHISTVESGFRPDCLCPCCQRPLVAVKGAIRIHHFRHKGNPDCQPETVAHKLGIMIMKERIESAISTNHPLSVQWKCSDCHYYHQLELMLGITQVESEYTLGSIRPDLALLDSEGQVRAIIEVVVTHSPESPVEEYCITRNIPLVEIRIDKAEDLEQLKESICIEVTHASSCPTPRCGKCDRPMKKRLLYAPFTSCWKCKQ